MVVRRQKKTRKLLGSKTRGWGAKKRHRGGGSRGGRGMAGLHKHKVMRMIKYMPDHFGKHGFVRPGAVVKKIRTINVGDLNLLVDKLLEEKKLKKSKDGIKLNLSELGYDKLLGKGKLKHKLIVEVKLFSQKAKKELEKVGGKLSVVK